MPSAAIARMKLPCTTKAHRESAGARISEHSEFRVGHVPKGHWDLVCRRVPKRHTVFAARRGCWTSQENLKGAQICAKADASFSQGVRLILRRVTVTFPTPQTPFVFARSKRKGEKECITKRNNRTFRRRWPTT